MTPDQTQAIRHEKYAIYVEQKTVSPKLSAVLLYCQLFSRHCTFCYFPINSHATKFVRLGLLPRKEHQPVFPHGSQCPHKVWFTLDENCRTSSILKFPGPYGLVLRNLSRYHKIFNFC